MAEPSYLLYLAQLLVTENLPKRYSSLLTKHLIVEAIFSKQWTQPIQPSQLDSRASTFLGSTMVSLMYNSVLAHLLKSRDTQISSGRLQVVESDLVSTRPTLTLLLMTQINPWLAQQTKFTLSLTAPQPKFLSPSFGLRVSLLITSNLKTSSMQFKMVQLPMHAR